MPSKALINSIPYPEWANSRYRRLDALERFLYGNIFDHLTYSFYQEQNSNGDYIALRNRRPSVIYNIARVVVSRFVSLLFGDKHWPRFFTTDQTTTEFLQNLVETSALQGAMIEAATVGSLGSVFVLFHEVDGKFLFEVWPTKFCSPVFDNKRDLDAVELIYPTYGYDLAAQGFNIAREELGEMFFYGKHYNKKRCAIYSPVLVKDYDPEKRFTIAEEIKNITPEVPGVWGWNFPNTKGIDSPCTFEEILDIYIEICYQLSQCGRGLKYNADPQLLIKEPPAPMDAQMGLFDGVSGGASAMASSGRVRSANNALFVGPEGDAKLLEISGQGQKVTLEFVKTLRQYALEVARGSHKDPEKAYGNMSGRAMEILDEDMIALAAVGRLSYGEHLLKSLLLKVLRVAKRRGLKVGAVDGAEFEIKFQWGNWFDPTPADHLAEEQSLDYAVRGRRLFETEARQLAAQRWGVGHAKPEKAEQQLAIPERPQMIEDEFELAKLGKAARGANDTNPKGASGGNGRDARGSA